MTINEQVTDEEVQVIKELALVPAVAELSGVAYSVAYKVVHHLALPKPHPRAFAVAQIAKQLVAAAQQLKQQKIRRKRRAKPRPKLYQIYDLVDLREALWAGDKQLVAQMTDVSRNSIHSHLSGATTPYKGSCKLAWRVLLAKIESNRAFTRAWQSADKGTASIETFRMAVSSLFPCDALGLGQLLGRVKSHCTYWIESVEAGIEEIPPHVKPLAAAVVLRAQSNKQFLEQVRPWLGEINDHGSSQV